ncbi:MAG TPA: recombinase family protein [Syntrophorhabdales bacterium]|nr:recombinase family protein [Syntrophorhabdales bacterium]
MNVNDKIKPSHSQRCAYIYIRQSTASQVQFNRESTDRQYKLKDRAVHLGWPPSQIKIIDEDLTCSGSGTSERPGFTTMTTEVALGHVGLVLSIEVSRVARNNADWYRLLDLCSVTDTLIGDEDGIYHPGLFNDRLLLGLKGTMAEAELHVIRARLEGGIRNKAARGELRRGLPIGFTWGEADGEVIFHPDQAVTNAIATVFEKFDETGSVRQVWLWFRSQGLSFPSQSLPYSDIRWLTPTYTAIHQILINPVYAGAYTYGKTHQERYLDQAGRLKKRIRRLPRSKWAVLIRDHHKGFIDWETYEMNQSRIAKNTRPLPHQAAGAIREGSALLQGIAKCGRCGRNLKVYYQGRNSTPGYYCPASTIYNGRGMYCLRVGGVLIDKTVAQTFLDAITPAGIEAAFLAEKNIGAEHDAAIAQCRLQVERIRYEALRAERRYRTVEPDNRLVARTLEAEWEQRLSDLSAAEAELARRLHMRPFTVTDTQRKRISELGSDLRRVWDASTTSDRDKKELFQTLLEEVIITVEPADSKAHLTLRWRGGSISELDLSLKGRRIPPVRTDEDTIDLVRRLAAHYSDAVIAGILNRQGRQTAHGDRFTINKVGNLRRYWKIPRYIPDSNPAEGELVTVAKAAKVLGMAPSTLHRWLADGFIAGEQITPGAPWRIRISQEIRDRFVEQVPLGHVPIVDAIRLLGISRQTVLQRVKRGELSAVHVRCGKQKGLYIQVIGIQQNLFDELS